MKAPITTALALLLPLTAACGAGNPADLPPVAGGPDAGPSEPGPVSLSVIPSAAVTPWPAIPVTGHGPANGTLVYETQNGLQDTARLGATGEFCLDVPLVDGDNTIHFEAISEDGTYSAPELLTVRREGEPPEIEPVDPGDVILADRTPGAVYYGQDVPYNPAVQIELEIGTFPQLVDGNTSDFIRFHSNDILTGETLAFSLSERMPVHGFEISVPDRGGETCGPDAYQMWISDDANPEMNLDGVTWHKIAERSSDETSATATTYEDESIVPGIMATHVAIKLTNYSCYEFFSFDPRSIYGLSEIRVIAARDGDATPLPNGGAPSCAAGGF